MSERKKKYYRPYKRFLGCITPNWLMCRSIQEISFGAKATFARLAQYQGKEGTAHPKVITLAKEIGVTERTCQKYLKELEEKGLIEREYRHTSRNTPRTTIYHFVEHPWMTDESEALGSKSVVNARSSGKANNRSPVRVNGHSQRIDSVYKKDHKEESTPFYGGNDNIQDTFTPDGMGGFASDTEERECLLYMGGNKPSDKFLQAYRNCSPTNRHPLATLSTETIRQTHFEIDDIIELFGGEDQAIEELNDLFSHPPRPRTVREAINEMRKIHGLREQEARDNAWENYKDPYEEEQ